MPEFPYTPNPPNIGRFLDHVQSTGVPPKVTQPYLESVGFKSKNDRYLITVMKAIGFLDGGGAPTDNWRGYRDKSQARAVLAAAIRLTYSDLFEIYPDAYRKDEEALRNYFASKTEHAKATLDRVVRSFKVLCEKADFEVSAPQPASIAASPTSATGTAQSLPTTAPAAPVVNINIQLQLPATDDSAVYDNLFAAMKKHLF